MFDRLGRIRSEFGTTAFVKTVILLAGLPLTALFGFVAFRSPWAAVVVVAGVVIGWLLRRMIVEYAETLFWAAPASLVIYSLVLFAGEGLLGLSREGQLLIITVTTVLWFNIQFWALSDLRSLKRRPRIEPGRAL